MRVCLNLFPHQKSVKTPASKYDHEMYEAEGGKSCPVFWRYCTRIVSELPDDYVNWCIMSYNSIREQDKAVLSLFDTTAAMTIERKTREAANCSSAA